MDPSHIEAAPISDDSLEGYDIIGDIHGQLVKLTELLEQLGYREVDGVWQHPHRKVIFIGDLIDRGPQQVEVVRLVQRMVAADQAHIVMGNHEYNAIAWATKVPNTNKWCRPHNHEKRHGHKDFLQQVGEGSALHHELVEWFRTLPLWLTVTHKGNTLRVVHACWHEASMRNLAPHLTAARTLTPDGLIATTRKETPAYEALETVLKGPEVHLGGRGYLDKDGIARNKARCRWWDADATTLDRIAVIPGGSKAPDGTPFAALPATPVAHNFQYHDHVPVIVGHYWLTVPTHTHTEYVACVDYSAATPDGPLVAYRWNGEPTLTDAQFVQSRH